MISEKTIEIFERANREYLKENRVYTSEQMKYVFAQRVIEHTLREVEKAVDKADLRDRTYTTYDKDMMDFCKSQVKKKIQTLISEHQ